MFIRWHTFVFSNTEANLNKLYENMKKQHYQVHSWFIPGNPFWSSDRWISSHLRSGKNIPNFPVTKKHFYGSPPSTGYEECYAKAPPIKQWKFLRILGLLLYLCKSQPDILTAVLFGATKSHAPKVIDYRKLLYIVEYLRITPDKGHQIYRNSDQPIQLYCTVVASYLLHPDSKGHTGYTIGFYNEGTFYNRSAKQSLVSTSSTHAEMRAIFTLVNFNSLWLCQQL